jgi:catechol 1,2-dioxygenase
MLRRKFMQHTGYTIIGMGVFGNISLDKKGFIGDAPTTTDVLGPFYRPGAPFRKNLNPPDFAGEVLHLKGTIFKEDGKTPMRYCLVEAWQCQSDGFYDNLSDDYLYRASQKIGADGKYHFITTQPVSEPTDETKAIFRPAHIHLRISAIGQQDLITQIYFKDDPYLNSDPSTKSALAFNRILSANKVSNNEAEIRFDIILKKQVLPADELFRDVCGIYKMSDGSLMEFYRDGDLLFYKTNGQIWGALFYAGNNVFTGGTNDTEARFELLPQARAKVQFRFSRRREIKIEGVRTMRYKEQK